MKNNFQVLIIGDDFRIADIHRQYVEKIAGFVVQDTVKTGKDALTHLEQCECLPHLILLDIYIPDTEGLDLFWAIRTTYRNIDIMIVTAAKEVETIEATIRGGIFDYIAKPADAARLEQTLHRYKQRHDFITSREIMEQHEIDFLLGFHDFSVPTSTTNSQLPKGIDPITLNEITQLLKSNDTQGITAVELSKQIGTSRSTARRYLEYLVSIKEIRTTLKYGNVGRPEREYVIAKK